MSEVTCKATVWRNFEKIVPQPYECGEIATYVLIMPNYQIPLCERHSHEENFAVVKWGKLERLSIN